MGLLKEQIDSLPYFVLVSLVGFGVVMFGQESILNTFFMVTNLTENELNRHEYINYLWSNGRKQFYSPFYKGVVVNVLESLVTLLPHR